MIGKTKKRKGLPADFCSSFCLQSALLLEAGMTLEYGMDVLCRQDQTEEEERAGVYQAVARGLESCGTLYEALKQQGEFPGYLVEMVGIGEKTGHLEETLRSLSEHYEREFELRNTVIHAVKYPLTLCAMLFIIVLVLILKVLPIFSNVLGGMGIDMRQSGNPLMRAGTVISYGVMVLLGLVIELMLVGALLWHTPLKPRLQAFLQKLLPPYGDFRKKETAARAASALSMMLSGGFPLEEALHLACRALEDEDAKKQLEALAEKLESGMTFADAVAENKLFDPLSIRLLQLGAASGQDDRMMKRVADTYEKQVEDTAEKWICRIEPALTALLAVVIGAILLSVMLPMMGLLSGML